MRPTRSAVSGEQSDANRYEVVGGSLANQLLEIRAARDLPRVEQRGYALRAWAAAILAASIIITLDAGCSGQRRGSDSLNVARHAAAIAFEHAPAQLRERLAVLRRPQEGRDRSFPVDSLPPPLRDVTWRSTRYLGQSPAGTHYYLVPVRTPSGPSPTVQRSKHLRLVLVSSAAHGAGGAGLADLHGLLRNMMMSSFSAGAHGEIAGVVPDGVTSVSLTFPSGGMVITGVHDNFWVIEGRARSLQHVHVTWLDERSYRVRTFPHGYGG